MKSESNQAESSEVIQEIRLNRYPLAIGIVRPVIATLACVSAATHQQSASRIKVGGVENFPINSETPIQLKATFIDPIFHSLVVTNDTGMIIGAAPEPAELETILKARRRVEWIDLLLASPPMEKSA